MRVPVNQYFQEELNSALRCFPELRELGTHLKAFSINNGFLQQGGQGYNRLPADVEETLKIFLRDPSNKLLIMRFEAVEWQILEFIQQYIVPLVTTDGQILYASISLSDDVQDKVDGYMASLTDGTPYQIIALSHIADEFGYNRTNSPEFRKTKIDSPLSKKFMSLNRRMRWHRAELIQHLLDTNLIDEGFVSFNNEMPMHVLEPHWPVIARNAHRFPMLLDVDPTINALDITESSWKYYAQSYINIITETQFFCGQPDSPQTHWEKLPPYRDLAALSSKCFKDDIIFTEKAYKSIVMCQPFVLCGNRNSLQAFKRMGYETFSSWWDESFDEIDDDFNRWEEFLKLVTHLISLPHDTWIDMYNEMIPVIHHNWEVWRGRETCLYNPQCLDLIL